MTNWDAIFLVFISLGIRDFSPRGRENAHKNLIYYDAPLDTKTASMIYERVISDLRTFFISVSSSAHQLLT